MFSNYKLKTSSGKQLKNIDHAHMVSLRYKLLSSARGCDDLSIDCDRDRNGRQYDLTNNKNITGKYHVRIMLKDMFGCAEYQERST